MLPRNRNTPDIKNSLTSFNQKTDMSSLLMPSAFATEDVRRTVLSNGLVALTKEVHTSPIVTSMIWYRVGSRNEELGHTGKSHFLEHMLFKGTDRFKKGEIDLLTLKNGGGNNAFTSHDFTAYYFNFASDRWEVSLDIEADRMVNCAFDPEEFEAEKKVVIEELKTGLDSPWGLLLQEVEASAYKIHPYRNPIVGWLQDVERATVQSQQAYYRRYYHPNNATLVIAGDFDTTEVLKKIDRLFGSIAAGPQPPAMLMREPDQRGERRLVVRWRSKVPRLAVAYHAPEIAHPDTYALQVLAVVLAEGKASRFYQRMVEREQTVTFISADFGEAKDPTLFHIRSEARGDHSIDEIESSIYDELANVAAKGVTDHELDRAKHQIEAHFILSRERTLDQAILMGQIETLLGLDYIDSYLQRVNAVTAADIVDVCVRYLNENNRTVGQLLSDGSEADDEEEELEAD
jgi:zinc protease